ncbi:MAG: ATP-dependent protease ATPase subunit HslU [Magnetococcales bacterium]|nr:ATP-dependent protease ATPase subunit HslU [Magnetococcales bacterium]MBF0114433.1 ATP-dependent protease ATPase subunit HslU [Magnetococcales bacterium]
MAEFTPRETVAELDRYIIGQNDAKRAVAVALRNRWRRQQLEPGMREEVYPKNILMIGPTGVGKTEIARRLAKLSDAPFIKVEATKFTEVGYVGRDVESIIRDLTDLAVKAGLERSKVEVRRKAEEMAEERVLELLLPTSPHAHKESAMENMYGTDGHEAAPMDSSTRQKFRRLLREGKLDQREVEIETRDARQSPTLEVFTPQGMEGVGISIQDMLGGMFGSKAQKRRTTVKEALELLTDEEASKLIDRDRAKKEAVERVEQSGIVFLDELDKVCNRYDSGRSGADVSREGVQRDLLPLVEGTTVSTKHGMVRTDHILFIASGAFQLAKPSDLLPELQGRLPIRVELKSLGVDEFVRILSEPENALTRQYSALLATEQIALTFSGEAVRAIAEVAAHVNETTENIGARRLHTVMEKLLDELSFTANERHGEAILIDAAYVHAQLKALAEDEDLSRFIL